MSETQTTIGSCGWQGYGFGASYQDAGCVEGMASDLDTCDEYGITIGGRVCPQCKGAGAAFKGAKRGPMALIRQQDRNSFNEWLEAVTDADVREELTTRIDAMFGLIQKLEEPTT